MSGNVVFPWRWWSGLSLVLFFHSIRAGFGHSVLWSSFLVTQCLLKVSGHGCSPRHLLLSPTHKGQFSISLHTWFYIHAMLECQVQWPMVGACFGICCLVYMGHVIYKCSEHTHTHCVKNLMLSAVNAANSTESWPLIANNTLLLLRLPVP